MKGNKFNNSLMFPGPYPPNPGQAPPYPGYGDGAYQGAYGYDGRGPLLYDPLARNSFVRLVMFIVLVMLLATSGVLIIVLTVYVFTF